MTKAVRAGRLGENAVVIGGSIAGLLAARVLADHFSRVTVIERDVLPDNANPRKGVPQARHVHLLLHRGQAIMEHFLPGLFAQMGTQGSVPVDLGLEMRWLRLGIVSKRTRSGIVSQFQSRPALERHIRRRVKALPNVSFIERMEVAGLQADEHAVSISGVRIRDAFTKAGPETVIMSDLIVDTSGRASHAGRWLEQLGHDAPAESTVQIDFAYASRIYRRPAGFAADWKVLVCYPNPPEGKRGAYIFPIEDNRWIVTMGSRLGDRPPSDEAGFLEFARTLPHPDVYEAIRDAEPVTPVTTFRFPANLWRHYEKLRRFPQRFIALGDAVCSFNPIYGQGMSICALEALALERTLRGTSKGELVRAASRFRKAVARIVEIPWMLVTTEDFRYPETQGMRSPLTRFINWYTRKVHELTVDDAAALRTLLGVMQMEKHPMALYGPGILTRLVAAALQRHLLPGGKARPSHPLSPEDLP